MTIDESLEYLKRKIGSRSYVRIKWEVYNQLVKNSICNYKTHIDIIISICNLAKYSGIRIKRVVLSKNRMNYKYRSVIR
jgi:hypothetical protein